MVLQHLIVMRHAHFVPSSTLSDHQSPLNERGQQAAKQVGGILRAKKIVPQILWSSDSARTCQTANIMFEGAMPTQTRFMPELYLASAPKILYLCAELSEPDVQSFMILAHNPGMEYLLHHFLSPSSDQAGTIPLMRSVPMGCGAVFERCDDTVNWLEPEAWKLADFIVPYSD